MEKIRLDKWLWAARFYKTRAMASEAINGGHVHLNGQRVKPSRQLNVGDQVIITRAPYEFVIEVRQLSARRSAASIAQNMYEETPESQQKREQLRQQLRLQAAASPSPRRRPDKQQRRKIIRFKNINQS